MVLLLLFKKSQKNTNFLFKQGSFGSFTVFFCLFHKNASFKKSRKKHKLLVFCFLFAPNKRKEMVPFKEKPFFKNGSRNSRKAEMVLLVPSFSFLVSKEEEWFVSSRRTPKKKKNRSVVLLASSFEEEQEEPFFKRRTALWFFLLLLSKKNKKNHSSRTALLFCCSLLTRRTPRKEPKEPLLSKQEEEDKHLFGAQKKNAKQE